MGLPDLPFSRILVLVQEIITDPWPIQGAQGCMVVLALLGQYKENKLGCPSNFGPTDSGGPKSKMAAKH